MRVSDDALDLVFRKARTYNAWLPKPGARGPATATLRPTYPLAKSRRESASVIPFGTMAS